MKEVWNKHRKYILFVILIIFIIIIFASIFNSKTKTTSSSVEKEYKVIKQTITGNDKIYKIVYNGELTDEKMKEIYEEYNENNKNVKVWFFDNEENAQNLVSYNVAEVKKENNEYKIHRYGEETEEEKSIRLEKERIAKEEEEKKKAEEERAKKEKEETDFKAECKVYTFEELARNPDNIKGSKVKLTGEVVQAMYGSVGVDLRVNITKEGSYSTYYTDTVYVTYYPGEGEDKILEDDIITIWGTAFGDTSYISTLGVTITLPYISAKYITIN